MAVHGVDNHQPTHVKRERDGMHAERNDARERALQLRICEIVPRKKVGVIVHDELGRHDIDPLAITFQFIVAYWRARRDAR